MLQGTGRSRAERLRALLESVQLRAAKNIAGLQKRPDEPGYNPDATATWAQCSVRTRCDLALVQGAMAAERAKTQATQPIALGVVVVPQAVASAQAWEQIAAKPPEGLYIEASATSAKPSK